MHVIALQVIRLWVEGWEGAPEGGRSCLGFIDRQLEVGSPRNLGVLWAGRTVDLPVGDPQRPTLPPPGPPRGAAVGGGKWQEAAGGGRRAGMGRHGASATASSSSSSSSSCIGPALPTQPRPRGGRQRSLPLGGSPQQEFLERRRRFLVMNDSSRMVCLVSTLAAGVLEISYAQVDLKPILARVSLLCIVAKFCVKYRAI